MGHLKSLDIPELGPAPVRMRRARNRSARAALGFGWWLSPWRSAAFGTTATHVAKDAQKRRRPRRIQAKLADVAAAQAFSAFRSLSRPPPKAIFPSI